MKAGDVACAVVTDHPNFGRMYWHVNRWGHIAESGCYEQRTDAERIAAAWNEIYHESKPWFVREVVLLAEGETPPPEGQMRLL